MNPTIFTIIISSGTSLIICLITVFVTAAKQNRNASELELLKFHLEQLKNETQKKQLQDENAICNFDSILEYTQLIKDGIILVNSKLAFQGFESMEIFDNLLERMRSLEDLYSKSFSKLADDDMGLVHDLKKEILQLQSVISRVKYEKEKDKISIAKENLIVRLEAIHKKISEVQQSFLRKRIELINSVTV